MNIIPLFIAIPLGFGFLIPMITRRMSFRYLCDILANLATFSLLILSLFTIGKTYIYQMGAWPLPIGINLVLDGLSSIMLIVINLVSFMATLYSVKYMEMYTSKLRYYSLFLIMVAGMNGVVLTGDLFNLFVFLEIASIASYALVGFGCYHEELEASFKYLVLGSVASTFVLLAIAITYATIGTLNMAQASILMQASGISTTLLFAQVLFLVGFGLKAALVPFHAWLPDAHPSAPAPISAMLSGVLIKVLGIYTIMRIFFNVFGVSSNILSALMLLGVISMVVGGLLAIGQQDIKRMFAYSSVSQIGYILLALGIATPLAITGAIFYLVNHAISKSLLFLNAGAIEYSTGTRDLDKMGGINTRMPVTGFTSLIGSLSISGIPPFGGFWSKLIIIVAAVKAGYIAWAIVATLVSILTLAYYMKFQKNAMFGSLKEGLEKIKEVPLVMRISMSCLAVLCVIAGLLLIPSLKSSILDAATNVLSRGLDYSSLVLGGAV
ncbi:complex I subunit 5 family protein [Candidatus Omnitrophota bacterium]